MTPAQIRLHVLVADDYGDNAEVLAEILTARSPTPITTAVAYDGAQAVELAQQQRPDLVILDIEMPVMNGKDAALAIRAAFVVAPKLVALTASAYQAEAVENRLAFDLVLTKPADVGVLLDVLSKLAS